MEVPKVIANILISGINIIEMMITLFFKNKSNDTKLEIDSSNNSTTSEIVPNDEKTFSCKYNGTRAHTHYTYEARTAS